MEVLNNRTHGLRGLLILQFVAAFNDNAWKLVVALLGIQAVAAPMEGPLASSEAAYQAQTALAFIVYTLPLTVASPFAGLLSDRWSKRTILVAMKLAEVALIGPCNMGAPGRAGGHNCVAAHSGCYGRQDRDPQQRGSVIAVSNTFIFGALILGSLSSHVFAQMGLAAKEIFVVAGVATFGATIWALWLLPLAFLRLLLILLANTFYRVTLRGAEHFPATGGALLAPNHVSFADGLFLITCMDRPIRFVVAQEMYEKRLFKPFLEAMQAVPISSLEGPRSVLRALRAAGRHLDSSEIVCLFPEGQITRTGMLLPFERLPVGRQGMLLVKGPNVMQGYLGRDDLTASVMRDGWYITGDLAMVDEDGFIRIMDRLSRFSKVGGEMVPHGRVEEALQEAVGAATQVFAVTGVPDERRGENLAVLHTLAEAEIPEALEKAAANGLPNLYLPRHDHFIRVEQLPLLGTGKLDLREVKRVAVEALANTPAKSRWEG